MLLSGAFCLLLAGLFFTACDNTDYFPEGYSEIVTIEPVARNQYILRHDNGTEFYPVSGCPVERDERFRGIAWYMPVGDSIKGHSNPVVVYQITPILTKAPAVLDRATRDSLGSDPIRLIDYYIADDYLNIQFALGSAPGSVHFLNLARNDTIGKPDYYELTHNGFKMDGPLCTWFVAFDLREIKATHSCPYEFTVKACDQDGQPKEFRIVYDWEKPAGKSLPVADKSNNHLIMEIR